MKKVSTSLVAAGSIPDQELKYVVLGARYRGKWLFVRHRLRSTFEMVSGHIEPGESPEQAAVRELFEEAGVLQSALEVICDYRVHAGGRTEAGRFYGVRVLEKQNKLEFETGEVLLADTLPGKLTYPEVHSALFHRAMGYFGLSQK